MKKVVAIFIFLLYTNLAFSSVVGCRMDWSTASSAFRQAALSCGCSCAPAGSPCCYESSVICSGEEAVSNVFVSAQPLDVAPPVVQILRSIQLDYYSATLLLNQPCYTSYTPSKTLGERLAFIHLLRI